jgi:hypothetical protein
MWLSKQIREDVTAEVRVFYVHWEAAKQWNEKRDKDEPRVFTGWYWAHRGDEGGPFKSMSACYRDAWFRAVQHRAPPRLQRDIKQIDTRINRQRQRDEAAQRGTTPAQEATV